MARAGGFAIDGAEKWEREHPQWPHHALVVDRFGSWRAALHSAGLPGPPPLALPRHERIETVQRLLGRLSAEEIADLLGVNVRTVRRYWRATRCPRCGGPQIVPSANSCADCIPYVALRRPSKAAILRALRHWTRETGAPPRIADWREPSGKWDASTPPGRPRETCRRASAAGRPPWPLPGCARTAAPGSTGALAHDLGWTRGCAASGSPPVCRLVPAIQFIGYDGYPGHGSPRACSGSCHAHLHISRVSPCFGSSALVGAMPLGLSVSCRSGHTLRPDR